MTAPQPVLIQASVEGRNRPLTLAEMLQKMAPVADNATLREQADPAQLVDWISARLG